LLCAIIERNNDTQATLIALAATNEVYVSIYRSGSPLIRPVAEAMARSACDNKVSS